jgi:hypothetical protein
MELLRNMHAANKDTAAAALPTPPTSVEPKADKLHHMTTKVSWLAALESGEAYYPPTFEVDGHYTHATAVPARLVTTANHFYQETEGEW